MTTPTPIGKHRRYTRRQKATAVIAATMTSVLAASEEQGIPASTITYWMDEPEFVILREKTREDIALETRTLAVKVLGEIKRRIGEFDPRDLSILYGILTEKSQLLAGEATSRNEHRDITAKLDDHELDAIEDWLHDKARERMTVDAD